MLKLFNLSTHEMDLSKFMNDPAVLDAFVKKYSFDGIELITNPSWEEEKIPSRLAMGLHLRFWPLWLDFWRGDRAELLRQFGDMGTVGMFYGGPTREAMVESLRNEADLAERLGVKYAVMHISHVETEHTLNYRFTYSDEEVVTAGIELVNSFMDGRDRGFELLFENLWWPGLTLLDRELAEHLLDQVKYPRKGFMLDISHMMNTNTLLSSEEEAAEYILGKLENLGSLAGSIKGLHMNSSLSGEYVRASLAGASLAGTSLGGEGRAPESAAPSQSFFERYRESYRHVLNIDRHVPFRSPSIRKVADYIKPEYLVYEFFASDAEELGRYAMVQDEALGIFTGGSGF